MICLQRDNLVKLILLLLFFAALGSCRVDHISREFMAFYYPIYDLQEGKVYEYRPVENDTLPVDYWYYSSHKVDDKLHFTGNYYNERFQVQQFFRETQEENSMELNDFILYDTDEKGKQDQIDVEILTRGTFPTNFADSTKTFQMGVKWGIPGEDGTTISLSRERKYIGMSKYTYQGKKVKSAIFKTVENIEHFVADDGYLEPSFPGIEIYAEGIGLVYYKKQLSEAVVIEYALHAIYSMKEFDKKFKRSLEQ
jgi:hypothetical protein